MTYMLCRNRVADFRRWKRVFDSHRSAHRAAGLRLAGIWRDLKVPRDVFFLFEVQSVARARAFISAPGASAAARESGVRQGDYRFLRGGRPRV
jgi:hypothetical protein